MRWRLVRSAWQHQLNCWVKQLKLLGKTNCFAHQNNLFSMPSSGGGQRSKGRMTDAPPPAGERKARVRLVKCHTEISM